MGSTLLFHGPGAREAAVDQAYLLGRLLEPPIGDQGLKVEEARRVVHLLSSVPMGEEKGVVVIGPMDMAKSSVSQDVLLKSLEEFDSRYLQPILWAHDLGGVLPTIQSRCLDRWAPSTGDIPEDDELVAAGYDLIQASLQGEYWRLHGLIKGYTTNHKGGEYDLLRSAADALYMQLDGEEHRRLWMRLREAASHRNPTAIEVLVAFLPPLS